MTSFKSAFVSLCMALLCSTSHSASSSATLSAQTRFIELDNVRIAYRVITSSNSTGVPLLLLNRFRGTMDHWDPDLIDRIAAHRPVVMFDQPGFARSGGTASDSLSAFAGKAAQLVQALNYRQVDVLGFSMGGTVALQFALDHPQLLRKLVIAGSGPGFVPSLPPDVQPVGAPIWQVATKPVNDDNDFLFLFFEDTASSKAAGRAYLDRLRMRRDAFEKQVGPEAWQAQLKSAQAVSTESTTLMPRLKQIAHPVLVANGRHDVMVPTYASYAMAQALPNAWLVVYPDSGHGFLFQHAESFALDLQKFLR